MTEIVAALLLITFCLFIWKMVKAIQINVHVQIPTVKVVSTSTFEQPAQPVLQSIEPLYDANGQPLMQDHVRPDVLASFNEYIHGIEEAMNE
jgi:hypothetical protein